VKQSPNTTKFPQEVKSFNNSNDLMMKFKQSPEKKAKCVFFWEAFGGGRVGGTGKVQLY
jgi:hypothetical protein